jgi:F0F1-type ATP synthase membrane subunit b/b'
MATQIKIDVRNVDLRNVQEQLGDRMKWASDAGRKVVLAYAGLLGMAYDETKSLMERGEKMLDEATERGEKVSETAMSQVKDVRNRVEHQVEDVTKTVEGRVEGITTRVRKQMNRTQSMATKEIEGQVKQVLKSLDLPSRDRLNKLSKEIDALTAKIDTQLVVATEGMELPIADYDSLTVKEINAKLDGLSIDELAKIQTYEAAHANRVTIMREMERRLEPVAA